MNVVYVDNDEREVARFAQILRLVDTRLHLFAFTDEQEALAFLQQQRADLLFLEAELRPVDGISLAKRVQKFQPELPLVFVTAKDTYALQAFEVEAAGYLLKPCSAEQLRRQIRRICLRFHISEEHVVYFQTMPRFELYVDGRLVPIRKRKVKELLALLVDFAGSSLTGEQILTYLWEDRPNDKSTKALLRMTAKRLRELLVREAIESILIDRNGVRAIDMRKVHSDYFDLLAGDREALGKYQGEYMSEYSWAEITNGRLQRLARNLQAGS